jgi:hypothetical protein
MGFGQFVRNALFAPVGMRLPHGYDLLFERLLGAVRLFGCGTGELLQRGIAAGVEAGFPVIEGAAANMGGATGQRDIATRLPGFEEQPTLLGRRQRKMDVFGHAVRS